MSEMYWAVLFWLVLMILSSHQTRSLPIKSSSEYLKERKHPFDEDVSAPNDSEDLPAAAPVKPGHSLLRPSTGMLMSAAKFPQDKDKMLVYGNLDDLSITYGKTNERVLHTGFRKVNDILDMLLSPSMTKYSRKPLLVYIRKKPRKSRDTVSQYGSQVSEEENNASEILDVEELFGKASDVQEFRRKYKSRKRKDKYKSDSIESDSSTSGSSDYEKNPGNPFTVHKDKYIQNWLWNHFMDGDHMNINPYGPQFNSLGPSGVSLFFNRKWWYYNQDDYKPFD